jgi:hypothetical protein
MKISDQALALQTALQAWVDPIGGVSSVVANFKAMWEQASQSSQKVIILICYLGERIRGPFADRAVGGRVDQTWNVAVVRGRGFASKRGDTLVTTVGGADPFLDQLEEAKDIVRNLEGISAEWPVEYIATKPMQLGGDIKDGYLIEFSTANDLPKLKTQGN